MYSCRAENIPFRCHYFESMIQELDNYKGEEVTVTYKF